MQYPEKYRTIVQQGFTDSSVGKESACNVGDLDSIPELGRSPGVGKGYPLQCSGLEKPMDCSHGSHSRTRPRGFHFTAQQLAYGAALMDRQEAVVLTAGGRGVGDGGAEGP